MIAVYRKNDGEIVALSMEENIIFFLVDQYEHVPSEIEYDITDSNGNIRKEKVLGFNENLMDTFRDKLRVFRPITDDFDILKFTDKSVDEYLDTEGHVYEIIVENPRLDDGSVVNMLCYVDKRIKMGEDGNPVVAKYYTEQDKKKYRSKVVVDPVIVSGSLSLVEIMQTKKIDVATKKIVDRTD